MFTGIVEELGTVESIHRLSDAVRLRVRADTVLGGISLGDSISVDGCCLTVARADDSAFEADVMAETLDKTTIGRLVPGDPVNLERAVTVDKRLGGHIVQGHVDGVGTVTTRTPGEHWEVLEISVPPALARYLVDKGSITVDGVSLTVVSAPGPGQPDPSFTVSLIPETLARTTLGRRAPGEPVNLEVDVLAKYVERLLTASTSLPEGATHE